MNDILNDDQKKLIIDTWNTNVASPPDLQELIDIVFPDMGYDGRSRHGRAVRKFLSSRKLKVRSAHEYKLKTYDLSESEQQFIENNYTTMTAHEIAKTIFSNSSISHRDRRTLAVINKIKQIADRSTSALPFENPNDISTTEYRPPKSPERVFVRIKKYVNNPFGGKEQLGPRENKCLNALIDYVSTFRFLHQINGYESNTDKELFESSFVRYTHDKPDLTQEEVDQYIVLSQEVVISAKIQRRVERLQVHLDRQADESEEGAKISMGLVESINTAQTEYNQCVNRQQKLLSDLKEKRSDKLRKQIQENASILNLVEVWKDEEERNKLQKYAEMQKVALESEVNRLTTMEDIKCKIMGLTVEEALYG